MKKLYTVSVLILSFLISNAQGTWTQKANFGGSARWGCVAFTIGLKGYVATGNDGSSKNDLWEWDQTSNTWSQKANCPCTPRFEAAGFAIGTKGYVCTGDDGTYRNDLWEWDQTTNTWLQKANFPGTPRNSAVGFAIGTKGYLGTGYDSSYIYHKDFWEWDPNGVGVDEIELKNSISVFPNPSNGLFQIHSSQYEISKVTIYNVQGEKIYESQSPFYQSAINIISQPKGIYFLKVQSADKVYTEKVVVQQHM